MPHKHTRKSADSTSYNLPPTTLARPLPARQAASKKAATDSKPDNGRPKQKKARIEGYGDDDTPRAFARLMRFGASGKGPNSLDNGERTPLTKKRKRGQDTSTTTTTTTVPPAPHLQPHPPKPKQKPQPPPAPPTVPKILPGESISSFSARVNLALPISGLARKGNKTKVPGVRGGERQTKTEKRLQKMYAEWRTVDAARKERAEEARELDEEAEDERDAMYGGGLSDAGFSGGKKAAARRRRMLGEVAAVKAEDEDPWAELQRLRGTTRGLRDVAQAPPTFSTVPREKFRVRNGARAAVSDVPNAAGSLARREELGEARRGVIERYREMMRLKT
ncbi:hypothetical protein LTR50_003456 [Elasticomyces elasticus]|nr:hypothetical protein LTR50_003456 [Elasticomyces elasticus]